MRIYLDMCCLQRPMDDQSNFRVHMEAEAILGILVWCNRNHADLLDSVALRYEHAKHTHPVRKAFSQEILQKSAVFIALTEQIASDARNYEERGIKALDALHLACAVNGNANYFCTCDDRFLRRAKLLGTGQTKVVSPVELFEVIEP